MQTTSRETVNIMTEYIRCILNGVTVCVYNVHRVSIADKMYQCKFSAMITIFIFQIKMYHM